MGAEMQNHYNLLSTAGKLVPAPVGGAADWNTDKEYSIFMAKNILLKLF